MMRHAILGAAALLATAAAVEAQSVGGSYAVAGTNLDGSPYAGTAEITGLSDTTCEITWVTGSTTSQGICMRNGNALAAGYVLGDATGLAIYLIMEDGTLDGVWTVAGEPGQGTEVLTPQ